jgi:hypothetical protein
MASILNATTSSGLVTSADNSGSLQLATNNGTTAVTIDTSQNVGIGTSSPTGFAGYKTVQIDATSGGLFDIKVNGTRTANFQTDASSAIIETKTAIPIVFNTSATERMRIDSAGEVLIGKTSTASSVAGIRLNPLGTAVISRNDELLFCNRLTTDGALVQFQQDGTSEGNISVSGTTVSYNGGHLSRWSQLPDNSKDDTILKGTVLTNLDDMCVWTKDGTILDNEQLNKMKVSDVEGDTNVAGVFVNWTRDEDCNSDDMNVAMTGDMIIRIADGVVVQKGDLLMSAGDGTAKPQGDDIVRSKTIAKVTSNHVTCTYADGSYCVPCVLMAC